MPSKEFRRFYVDRTLPVARVAIGLGIALVAAVCLMDAFLMPSAFAERAIPLRIVTMLLPLSAALAVTYLIKERIRLPFVFAAVSLLVGVSTIVVGGMAEEVGAQPILWGVIFTTFNSYLVLGLDLRLSTMVGWPIFLFYTVFGLMNGAPLQEMAYGALFLGVSNLVGTYTSYLLERNAREIFENKRELARLARIDGFTELYNRHAFDEHLQKIWKHARRDGKHIAIAVADIDHFKLYNDCYGHQKGDECIKCIADVLAASVERPLDMVARYGGEEFVIVLYDATVSYLESFTRNICHKVVDEDIAHKASEAASCVTLSIGAAITEAAGTLTPEQLLRQADDALYEAKSQGRNQAIVYKTEWGQQTTAQLAAALR